MTTVRFLLEIESGNDAFQDDPKEEMTKLLYPVVFNFTCGMEGGLIYDSNGNKVGRWEYTEK
jgi:hypothetical protein